MMARSLVRPSVARGNGVWFVRATYVIAAAVALTVGARSAEAQGATRLTVVPKAGITFAGSGFGEYVDRATNVGLRLGYLLGSNISLVGEGAVDMFGGTVTFPGVPINLPAPDITVTRYVVGVEANLGSNLEGWAITAAVLGGVQSFKSDEFPVASRDMELSTFEGTYAVAGGTLQFGRRISERLSLVLDAGVFWSPITESDTQDLTEMAPPWFGPFDTALTVPVSIALRAGL